jgi:hypothetical protein
VSKLFDICVYVYVCVQDHRVARRLVQQPLQPIATDSVSSTTTTTTTTAGSADGSSTMKRRNGCFQFCAAEDDLINSVMQDYMTAFNYTRDDMKKICNAYKYHTSTSSGSGGGVDGSGGDHRITLADLLASYSVDSKPSSIRSLDPELRAALLRRTMGVDAESSKGDVYILYLYIYIYIYGCVCVCVDICLYKHTCRCAYRCVYVHINVCFVCAYVGMCMCVYVYMCISM